MDIQASFDEYRAEMKGAMALMLMDREGETVIMSAQPDMDTYETQLFGAQFAVLMAKEIQESNMDYLFMKAEDRSAAARMLPNGYFLCVYFNERTFAGYAEQWLDRIAEIVNEEFF